MVLPLPPGAILGALFLSLSLWLASALCHTDPCRHGQSQGTGISCYTAGRRRRALTRTANVFRARDGTHPLCSLPVSEDSAPCPRGWKVDSVGVEEREGELWRIHLPPTPPSAATPLPHSLATHIPRPISVSAESTPSPHGSWPEPHLVTASSSKTRVSGSQKVFPRRF